MKNVGMYRRATGQQLGCLHSGIATSIRGHVLFNDALNTFYLRLYGVRHIVKVATLIQT